MELIKKHRKVSIALRMDPEFVKFLDSFASDNDMTRTDVIETAVWHFISALARAEEKPKKKTKKSL